MCWLSRAPTQDTPTVDEVATQNEVEIFIDVIAQQLPASSNKLKKPNMMILFVTKLLATAKVIGHKNTQSKLNWNLTGKTVTNSASVMIYFCLEAKSLFQNNFNIRS